MTVAELIKALSQFPGDLEVEKEYDSTSAGVTRATLDDGSVWDRDAKRYVPSGKKIVVIW